MADLEEPLYVKIPEGYRTAEDTAGKCLKLLKVLPGIKQGARQWFIECANYLEKIGFKPLETERSIFMKEGIILLLILLLYVDDMLILAKTKEETDNVVDLLKARYVLTVYGKAVPKSVALGMLLSHYSAPSEQKSLCVAFGVPTSTVSRVLAKAAIALEKALECLDLARIKYPCREAQADMALKVQELIGLHPQMNRSEK
jgi:hypothetical protein